MPRIRVTAPFEKPGGIVLAPGEVMEVNTGLALRLIAAGRAEDAETAAAPDQAALAGTADRRIACAPARRGGPPDAGGPGMPAGGGDGGVGDKGVGGGD